MNLKSMLFIHLKLNSEIYLVNLTHRPGGGNKPIENQMLTFRRYSRPKVDSGFIYEELLVDSQYNNVPEKPNKLPPINY
jgi:hypothetical protein